MGFRRKPPEGNVRRVAAIDNNSRYAITNKNGETVQCESHTERKLALRIDRDPQVKNYRSQPLRISYIDSEDKSHTYVPDFQVWRWDGSIELHEVTLSERRLLPNAQRREKAAQEYCNKEGWRYIVHTEQSLPQEAEAANLLALLRYRPKVYAHECIATHARLHLQRHESLSLGSLTADLASDLTLPQQFICAALCHLLWNGILDTNFHTLFAFEGAISPDTKLWLAKNIKEERY